MSKKVIPVFLFSIVCCLSVMAQTGIRYNMKYVVSSYGSYEARVDSRDSADFFRLIFPRDSSDNLFPVNDFYKNGKPKMVGKSIDREPRVRLQGVNVEFFPNGEKKSERNFKDNRLVGNVTQYFPNGKLYLIGKYDDNSRLIIKESRDSTGELLITHGNGRYIEYSSNFENVLSEGSVLNGLKEGEWKGQPNDSVKYVCTYNKGIIKKGLSHTKSGQEYSFSELEVDPMFKGGIKAFHKFLRQNVHYPAIAKENDVQGIVYISFVVEKDGSLTNIRVVRNIGSGCDEEAVRAIELSSPWMPGTLYGIPIHILYTMPISFTLQVSR